MPPVKSIKLSIICGAVLGTSIVCSTAFAQSLNPGPTPPATPGPTPVPNSFPTPTPNPNPFASPSPSPPPGVQVGGVAIPVPVLNMAQYAAGGAHEDIDVAFLLLPAIQSNFNQALNALATATPGTSRVTQLLGQALIFDQTLSVNNNLACATCHVPYSGWTGGSSFFNATTSADPGSVPITNAGGKGPDLRISSRRPQTYAYAAFSPVLHYNNTQMDFYGGNFWDMRAGGIRLENPAAEQAQGPPTNPVEMGNLDIATYIYKLSLSKEAPFFEAYWGTGSLSSIHWPANIATLAATPGPPPAGSNPNPVLAMLSPEDQRLVISDYDHAAQSMAAYEAGPSVSPFNSKFDFALAGQTTLTADELAGWNLFHGKAKCNTCHLDGTENSTTGPPITPAVAADVAPLFTDFTSANIGTPQNFALPFLYENTPDQFGYVANAAGIFYLDLGVGGFLANVSLAVTLGQQSGPGIGTGVNPNPAWAILAPNFDGKVQVPTCRNVDLRPYPGFVKAYAHNGYFKSLKALVHFYNTRDTLNGGTHLPAGMPGEGITYWPPPEVNQNVDQTIGHLGLTDAEENQIVLFLQTLSDGFSTSPVVFNARPVPQNTVPPRFQKAPSHP